MGQMDDSVLADQSEPVERFRVFASAGEQIDSRGLHAGMPEQVRQPCNISAHPVEAPGEEMPQVVREHLGGLDLRRSAQRFHFRPDLFSGQTFSASGEKQDRKSVV